MVAAGRTGSVVTLLCDPGERYLDKYYSDAWLEEQGLDIEPYVKAIDIFLTTGNWTDCGPRPDRPSAPVRPSGRRHHPVQVPHRLVEGAPQTRPHRPTTPRSSAVPSTANT